MQRQKAIMIIATLLLVCFLLYLFFSEFNQTNQVSLETQTLNINEQIDMAAVEKEQQENISSDTVVEKEAQTGNISNDITAAEEGQLKAASTNDKQTITQKIKEKIREVVEGTIRLFEKDLKVVAIGDSLTQGVGDETESGGFVGILNHTFEDNKLNIRIENYGKRGNRTDQLLKRLENKDIASSIRRADTVLITIGSNDIMKVVKNNFTNLTLEPFQKEREEYSKRLRSIFNKVNELNPDTQIYLIGFYNPFEHPFGDIEEFEMIINDWNEASQSVTEEFENVNYIPIADLFVQSNIELLDDDHFHPNTSGYKLIAQRVLENLNEMSVETEQTKAEAE
jgi:lysophospholipase L1-like esterase